MHTLVSQAVLADLAVDRSTTNALLSTFFGALQGSISVLLTLFIGYLMARRGYMDHRTVRHVAKLNTDLFLPCLIVEQMGPGLTARRLAVDWIVPLWGLVSSVLGHAIGYAGKRALAVPYWTIVACGRPNANVLPLLLLQSLEHTGVLDTVSRRGESVAGTLRRAKGLILLNAVVQETVTFQFAPGIIARDRATAPSKPRHSDSHDHDLEGRAGVDAGEREREALPPDPRRVPSDLRDPGRVGWLEDEVIGQGHSGRASGSRDMHGLDDVVEHQGPSRYCPHPLRFLERPTKVFHHYVSPPLLGAVLALVIGITPPLHHAVLDEDGTLYSSATQTVVNLGELFPALQAFTVGAELALVRSTHPGARATLWVLCVRFVLAPLLALLLVWCTAGRGLYVDDRLVWFLLVLIPAGPSAMVLVSVAELVDVDQGDIAGYLTVAVRLPPSPA
ncbi:hypothetical protein GSI_01914 [Ganoderma sinense ZZ0214-1]|uniref:Transporter n=1 Tax=Ganoderma sinense ZZ0214-1 TaxID=1077348 RepID=A0A2G8SR81_9APHY|nr:hypothetical protein GSI_01914 [Ganoderma sinense ZZ0214-1]